MEIAELNAEELRLELHGEWCEFVDKCIGLFSSVENASATLTRKSRTAPRFS
jgi:hypothetical protein